MKTVSFINWNWNQIYWKIDIFEKELLPLVFYQRIEIAHWLVLYSYWINKWSWKFTTTWYLLINHKNTCKRNILRHLILIIRNAIKQGQKISIRIYVMYIIRSEVLKYSVPFCDLQWPQIFALIYRKIYFFRVSFTFLSKYLKVACFFTHIIMICIICNKPRINKDNQGQPRITKENHRVLRTCSFYAMRNIITFTGNNNRKAQTIF